MENIEGVTIDTKKQDRNCPSLQKKVHEIDTCLQNNGIHHNDLNSRNIMIDSKDNIIIIDFGEATEVTKLDKTVRKYCNPPKSGKALSRKTTKSRIKFSSKEKLAEEKLAEAMSILFKKLPNPKTPNPNTRNPKTPNPKTPNPKTPNPNTRNPKTPNPNTRKSKYPGGSRKRRLHRKTKKIHFKQRPI